MFKLRMSILLVLLIMLAGGALLVGCRAGSGNIIALEEDITGFDRLDVSQGFDVDVQHGDSFSVVIRVDDNLVGDVQVVKQGSTLQIGLKPGRSISLEDVTLEADISMPELVGLDLSGGSHVTLSGFKSSNALDADLSGGSHLQGDIEAGDCAFNLSGGSHVTLSGSAGDLTIDADGGSHVTLSGSAGDLTIDADGGSHAELANLAVVDADVNASGGSHVTVNPSGRLDAVSRGGSHVKYLGNPTLSTIDADSSSTIKQE